MNTQGSAALMKAPRHRDERGISSSYALIVIPVLLLMVGLVVDGGGKVAAVRDAQAGAAAAARAASDAAAPARALGQPGNSEAYSAARRWLATNHVDGEVRASGAVVTVTTRQSYRPIFLSLIGVTSLTGTGSASTDLRGVR